MVINLLLYLKRGQCIDLSPQKEPASWHGCGGLAAKPLSDCGHVCRFWQAQAFSGREMRVFLTGVLGRTIMLRQELLAKCHPLSATVRRAPASG